MRPSISKLLVANRGGSARRIVRTAREMGIATVAVFTDADSDAVFVGEADEAVALDRLAASPGGASFDAAAFVEAARRAGADAVHPGYGSPAGDAGLAWRCAEAGLIFVGSQPETIASLTSKLEAKSVAAGAGVPVLTDEEVDGYPPGKLEAAAEVVGWPVVVKAAAGRGGRAMRVVGHGDDLVGVVEAVRREATAAFGDGTVFLEPWLEGARYVEVQVFGDSAGRMVHLFERDGSLQRRHRTVITEAPAPKMAPPLRERLHAAALAVAEAVDLVGAGAAQFIVDGEQLWFLGMDTRLTADHPATEAILGFDLVRMQLAAAEGRPIPVEARHCSPAGHAVTARLYAEDPAAGYEPQTGRLRRFEIDVPPGLRVETGVASGSTVGGGDDRPLATVTAHAAGRTEAIRRLALALERMRIHGLRTNRDQLISALRTPEFRAGEADTGFLDRHHKTLVAPRAGSEAARLHAVAAAVAGPGPPASVGSATFAGPSGERIEVRYRIDRAGDGTEVTVDGVPLAGVRIGGISPDGVEIEAAGVRRRVAVARSGDVVDCDSRLGHTELTVLRVGYEA
jgi:propionyl-CoA carboxylase alpha chain